MDRLFLIKLTEMRRCVKVCHPLSCGACFRGPSFGRCRVARRNPGLTLGTVLACLMALVLILFTAGTAAVNHLRFSTAQASSDHAKNLAEAALAETLNRLVQSNFKFGLDGLDELRNPARVVVTFPDLPGASGTVTFDASESGFASGYSSNNIHQEGSVSGADGQTVPGGSVHVVARGKVGDTERWVECVYYRPPFPDGMACTGQIDAKSVNLAAVQRAADYPGGDPTLIPPEKQIPANIFSNANRASGAVATRVSASSKVSGSVGAVGDVSVSPDCVVGGEVLAGSEARAIPDVRLAEKFAIVEENHSLVSSSTGNLTLAPSFFVKATHGLTVGGDLNLNGSVLLVRDGNLVVEGGIVGTGIVLCDGDVEIKDGRSHLDTAEQVAIGCTGDFKLRAEAPENNYFNGLVYAEGDIDAKDITVVGAIVGNGKRGRSGSVTLDNMRFVHNPSPLKIAAFPPLVTAREWDDDAQFSSASALVRQNADGTGWIVEGWAGLQKTRRAKTKAEKDAHERGVNESDWNVEKIRAISPSTFEERTWSEEFSFTPQEVEQYYNNQGRYEHFGGPRTPEQKIALEQSYAYVLMMNKVAHWMDQADGVAETESVLEASGFVKPAPGKRSWMDRMIAGTVLDKNGQHQIDPPDGTVHMVEIVNKYRTAYTNRDESWIIHFNLNNLLAEFHGNNARVLLWRPTTRR